MGPRHRGQHGLSRLITIVMHLHATQRGRKQVSKHDECVGRIVLRAGSCGQLCCVERLSCSSSGTLQDQQHCSAQVPATQGRPPPWHTPLAEDVAAQGDHRRLHLVQTCRSDRTGREAQHSPGTRRRGSPQQSRSDLQARQLYGATQQLAGGESTSCACHAPPAL